MGLRKFVLGGVMLLFGFILACGGSGSDSDPSTDDVQSFSSDTGYYTVTGDELTAMNMTLKYKYEGTDRISFLITSATDANKWVGIGFNSTGVMEGADFKIGGASSSNVGVGDMYSSSANHQSPTVDSIQDVTNGTINSEGNLTTMSFTMPLVDDANGEDHVLQKGQSVFVLLAYGSVVGDSMAQHDERRAFSLTLSAGCTQDNNCSEGQTCSNNACVSQ